MGLTKIEQYGLVSDVLKMYYKGMGVRQISEWIEENHKVYISPSAIFNFVKNHRMDKYMTMESKKRVSEELEKMNIDIIREIASLYKEMREYFEELKKMRPDDPQIVRVADHLIRNLKVLAKISGDLKEVRTEVNILNLAPRINAIIKKYRDNGVFYCKQCGSTDIGIRALRLKR